MLIWNGQIKLCIFTLNFKYYGFFRQDICHAEKQEAIIILHLQ